MRWLKLFEQFDEEESWWNEESPFDNVESKLRIIENAGDFYLIKERKKNGNIVLFDDEKYDYQPHIFNLNPVFNEEYDLIGICDVDNTTKRYLYKDLPKEIKDRIVK